ncbi:MAG: ABC transporter permease, partial [Paucibacter sp.]|nr:ABC transporter permease [Roseateles sp.]
MSALIRLAWRYLWAQPLTAGLNLLLLSLGLAAISFVLLVSEQIEAGVRRDLAGIDLVVGAKGSPMQIMLSGVFHLDVPTGNIPLATLKTLRAQPL